jgi:hypothetical protein
MKLDIHNIYSIPKTDSQPDVEATPDPASGARAHHIDTQQDAFDERANPNKPSLQFGPIWVREAQRVAAFPSSPINRNDASPTSPAVGPKAMKEILCQPPTQEMHRDSLRHAFLSLSSSF